MQKSTYQTKKNKKVDCKSLREKIAEKEIAFAIDVTHEGQLVCQSSAGALPLEKVKWKHPQETLLIMDKLVSLSCPVTVIKESTSTFGDALRYLCRQQRV